MQANRPLIPLALFAVLWSAFSPLAPFVKIEEPYSYESVSAPVSGKTETAYAVSADASGNVSATPWGYETSGVIALEKPAGSFVLEVPTSFGAESAEDLRVVFASSDRTEVRTLDLDSPREGMGKSGFFTEPAVFPPTAAVSYRIVSKRPLPEGASVSATDLRSKTWRVAFDPSLPEVSAAPGGDTIVRRAEWGADEEWRFEDGAVWKPVLEKLAADAGKDPEPSTVAYREKLRKIEEHLSSKFPEQFGSVETTAQENGRTLVWPVERSKRVEKIVLHHTAENNLKGLSDPELLRATYRYHAISRGWGDIGYNFIIGQRGTVYEGRAGGDYSVGAHAAWNNRSTVGVSVIGNFDAANLVAEQKAELSKVMERLARKYGIDLSKTSYSHRECKKGADCLIEDYETPNLVGHRDVGYTSCPGANLYEWMKEARTNATYSFGLKPTENPSAKMRLAASRSDLPKGPSVRVRLSYPEKNFVEVEGAFKAPRFGIGSMSGTLKKNLALKVETDSKGILFLVVEGIAKGGKPVTKKARLGSVAFLESDVLRVKSWERRPSWDKTGTMNDNVFRGKLEVRSENGKIVLINELPLEDYLKGLGEVSNGDNVEKIKTILVAARSYAYFYLQKTNRKFPDQPYDASDNPDVFQKYLGYGLELRSPNVNRLVEETNGKMIYHSGVVVKPWYFNESDGKTLSYKEYCQIRVDNGTLPKSTQCKDIPYLMGAVDPGGIGRVRKGHGVGISGIGATYFATNLDWTYEQIIQYYLDGTEVKDSY